MIQYVYFMNNNIFVNLLFFNVISYCILKTTSDLIIQVHGNPIHVHKAILKIRCHYFRTMFQEHWAENSQR